MRIRRLLLPLVVLLALAPAASAEAKRLVHYQYGGGLAGTSVTLVIETNGAARQTGSEGEHRFTVGNVRLRELKQVLREARFSTLKRDYEPEGQVFDSGFASVRYRGKTVDTTSGADIPARLERVFRHLDRITRDD